MYIRKFEADSLDEALKQIKQELGPDAIILKTLTNRGLKGAFKKKKIEITAAISEKSYSKKAHVDKVLDDNQRQEFYSGSSSYISNMIDNHSSHRPTRQIEDDNENSSSGNRVGGYGKLGLNRAVNTTINKTKNISDKMKSSLDDFLSQKSAEETDDSFEKELESQKPQFQARPQAPITKPQRDIHYPTESRVQPEDKINSRELEEARHKIDELERKLFELTQSVERIDKREPTGIYQLRTTLRALDINEFYIQDIIKKCCFELNDEELMDQDAVFELALREMLAEISTGMPLFSSMNDGESVITVILSETSTGQTSMIQKLGALKEKSLIIRNRDHSNDADDSKNASFAEKIFDMGVIQASGIPEVISRCRKGVEQGQCIFVDYKNKAGEINETKKFIDGLRRSFDKVEVLVSLSAIHSEGYNRKVLNRYLDLADGIVISNLDLCLNYGALFNIAQGYPQLPLKFFGTGEVVPDDLEAATAERILAGVFKLNE